MNIEQGYFSIIRWCSDVAREEYHNLGVILVDENGHVRQIRCVPPSAMPAAIARPGLVTDWLSSLETRFQRERVGRNGLEEMSQALYRSLNVTEPRPTARLGGDWATALEGLWATYAKPGPRPPARHLRTTFERRWKALIRNKIITPDHPFTDTGSGQARSVEFFANSSAHIALETLDLALKRAPAIQDRADAEAMKILDIRQANQQVRFVVYCALPVEPALDEATQGAFRVLRHVHAEVETDADRAAREVERAVQPQLSLTGA